MTNSRAQVEERERMEREQDAKKRFEFDRKREEALKAVNAKLNSEVNS